MDKLFISLSLSLYFTSLLWTHALCLYSVFVSLSFFLIVCFLYLFINSFISHIFQCLSQHFLNTTLRQILRYLSDKIKRLHHSTYIRWELKTYCARIMEISSFQRKNIRFLTALDVINALNRSNNRDCSLRVHLLLTDNLIKVP